MIGPVAELLENIVFVFADSRLGGCSNLVQPAHGEAFLDLYKVPILPDLLRLRRFGR